MNFLKHINDKKIIVGSYYFFNEYSDYKSHDKDYIILIKNPIDFKNVVHINGKNDDIFFYRKMNKDEFIQYTLNGNTPMEVGKFTIEDLYKLEECIKKIDEKHLYEKIIYYSYIQNNSFTLTKEQRDLAYKEYKKYRY